MNTVLVTGGPLTELARIDTNICIEATPDDNWALTEASSCDLAACEPADIVAAYTSRFGADNCGGATDQTAHQYSTGCDTADCTKDQLELKFGACGSP